MSGIAAISPSPARLGTGEFRLKGDFGVRSLRIANHRDIVPAKVRRWIHASDFVKRRCGRDNSEPLFGGKLVR